MAKLMMDKIFERLAELNRRWLNLVVWATWENLTPEQLQEEIDLLRQEFANIITFAQTQVWRIIARSEGVQVEDEKPDSPIGEK